MYFEVYKLTFANLWNIDHKKTSLLKKYSGHLAADLFVQCYNLCIYCELHNILTRNLDGIKIMLLATLSALPHDCIVWRYLTTILYHAMQSRGSGGKGGDKLSPPFGEFLVTLTHFFDVIARVGCVGQHLYNICYNEIPFFVGFIPNRSDLLAIPRSRTIVSCGII